MARIGPYELLRPLGSGGYGEVFEALAPDGIRRVAVKRVPAGEGALREARVGALLRHRHLVDVLEVGQAGDRAYLAMELCALGSLATHLPLPPRAVVEVGRAVAEAMAYAHAELGLVHLDLKPSNLLVDAAGVVKVSDWGFAAAPGFGPHPRGGTRGYLAPEVLRGEAVGVGADVYALGVTLIELATGIGPGGDATVEVASGPVDDDPTLDTFDLDRTDGAGTPVPPWLWEVALRCLAPRPAERFETWAALAAALDALPAQGPTLAEALGVTARPPSTAPVFVGRGGELAALRIALASPGVVAVKGPAGVGKTRLADEAAEDGPLPVLRGGPVRDVPTAVAAALGVPLGEGSPGEVLAQLGRALAARGPAVVRLDATEHPRDDAGMSALVAVAPEARFLVTTRTAPPLARAAVIELGPLSPSDAERLLITRAAERGVDLSRDPDVGSLAARLDGLPLAIELAAGRLGVLSVREVVERLALPFLRRGSDDRRSTLEIALDECWDGLSVPERRVLAAVSVFTGPFAADAAAAVADPGARVHQILRSLVARSMVLRVPAGYRLLAAVREAAAARLAADPIPWERLARWLLARPPEGDLDDRCAASRWALDRGDAALASRLLDSAWPAWEHGRPADGVLPLAEAVAAATGSGAGGAAARFVLGAALGSAGRTADAVAPLRGALDAFAAAGDRAGESRAARTLAGACLDLGMGEDARALAERAVARARAAEDPVATGRALLQLARIRCAAGRWDEARPGFEEAVTALRGREPAWAAQALANLAVVHLQQDRYDEAERRLLEALAWQRSLGGRRWEGLALTNLALLYGARGQWAEQEAASREALQLHRALGNRRSEAVTLANLGNTAVDHGRGAEARDLLTAALALHRELGNVRSEAMVASSLGVLEADAGRWDEAAAWFERSAALARSVGDARSLAAVETYLAGVALHRGRPDTAADLLDRALVEHRSVGNQRFRVLAAADRADVAVARGEPPGGWLDEAARAVPAGATALEARVALARAGASGPDPAVAEAALAGSAASEATDAHVRLAARRLRARLRGG